MTTKTEQAEKAATLTAEALLRVAEESGLPIEAILAGAHAQIVTMMVTTMGGPLTAESCERAAAQVRTLPSLRALSLAFAAPEGHA